MDGQHRVEQVRQADALRFRNKSEKRTVPVEAPRTAQLRHLEAWLVVPVDQFVGDPSVGRLVCQFEGFRAEPLRADDRYEGVWDDAATSA